MKNKTRIIFQALFLGMVGYVAARPLFDTSYRADFEAYCPFGGLASIMSKLNMGNMSCQMSEVQVMMGVGLLIGVVLLGKLFCSYVCPIGSVTEWLGKLGEKLKIRKEIPNLIDRPLRSLKYILLFITIYFTMTSSELFCKKFDPYFASVYLFDNSDIFLWFAVPAFAITILGTMVSRLFWCKYLCPLSALSNIFLNVAGAGAVILLYIILNALGMELSLVWLLAGIIGVGLITEVVLKKSVLLPLVKINRNSETCTDCGICEDNCPQGIKLTEYENVNHVDCNLCTDCVYSCPVKQSITINKKAVTKYLAPVATVLLIVASLGFSSNVEFTTISERWGGFEKLDNVAVYKQSDLKNIKCYGSAISFKRQIESVKGIYGVDAYAASRTVEIFYNPTEIDEKGIKSAMFTPARQKVHLIKSEELDSLAVWEIGIDNLFDKVDYSNLFYALRDNKGIYGFETQFGEPVEAVFFYDPSVTNPNEINEFILTEEVEIKLRGGRTQLRELSFELNEEGVDKGFISVLDYKRRMFKGYNQTFNKYKEYGVEQLSVLIYPMPEAGNFLLARKLSYITSHLSNNKGIVRFSTAFNEEPTAYVYFDPEKTTVEEVKAAISNPVYSVTYRDGSVKDVDNPFKSKPEGIVKNASEVSL